MNRATDASRDAHRWRFVRTGGFDQVALGSAADLLHLHELDPKLWTALACPTAGLEFDAQTLLMLDANGDRRITVQEVLEAVRWTCERLIDPQVLFAGEHLDLETLKLQHPDGPHLYAAGRRILDGMGRTGSSALRAEDLSDKARLFPEDQANGDGVVTAAMADTEGLGAWLEAILKTQGAVPDRSGAPGVDQKTVEAFFAQLDAVRAWRAAAPVTDVQLMPLGERTAAAHACVEAVAAKVEDYFTRCRLVAFDPQAAVALNPAATAYAALGGEQIAPRHAVVEGLPLAQIAAGAALPLNEALNPAWAERMQAMNEQAVQPLLGPLKVLTAQDWRRLLDTLQPYAHWLAGKPASALADWAPAELERLGGSDAQARLLGLIDRDRAAGAASARIDDLRRLVHYRRDLLTLLRNFVALSDLYAPGRRAIFQAGTLYIDRRSCELVLRVSDLDAHARVAPLSHCYLVYCRIEREGQSPQHIVAALTAGSTDELMAPGRHGVFVDRAGQEWLATVIKVVEQAVSIRQAFFTPYRRAAAFVETQIRNFATAKDKESDALTQSAVTAVATPSASAAAPPPAPSPAAGKGSTPFDIARFAGIFAALGLAVGAIGTALSAAVTGLFQLTWWQIPLAVAGALSIISGPSMTLAWLKLRRRNLGPLLDANGWAINARARINLPFGRTLTAEAALPPHAQRTVTDPFADERNPWPLRIGVVLAVALLAWWLGDRLQLQWEVLFR